MTRKAKTSLRDRLQATKQTWEEARKEALRILNASYDERHGPCVDGDGFNHFTDEMIDISIEDGYSDQPPGYCSKLFLKLNGGPDLRTISVKDDLNDVVGEQLHDIGFDEVVVEQIDGIDLSWYDTHKPAPKPKNELGPVEKKHLKQGRDLPFDYVQVIDGKPVASFTKDELAEEVRKFGMPSGIFEVDHGGKS